MREISRGRSRTHGCSTGEEESAPAPATTPRRERNGVGEKGGLRAAAGVGGGGMLRRDLAAAERLGVFVAMFGAAGAVGFGETEELPSSIRAFCFVLFHDRF
jgi:hypothetical protein